MQMQMMQMAQRNTVIRGLHDLGLAAWFGGSLMGAVGLNKAAEQELTGSTSRSGFLARGGTSGRR